MTIAVDRQEVTIDGKNAIDEFEEKTGTKIISIVNAVDIYNFLREDPNSYDKKEVERLANYIRVYGTDSVREIFGKLEQKIIESDKSIIIACDVSFEEFEELIKETADIKGVGGYKIPATSGRKGWEKWIKTAKKYTDKPLIYDHQKAGTDIPDTAKFFMSELKEAGFDSVILFPQAGPETERAWIYEALNNKLRVIVGGEMTHQGYRVSEGGFITDEGILKMYRIAAKAGINNFVVPGNKSEVVKKIKETIENEGISPTFYSPGFIAQGEKISETAKVAGDKFHGIIGRGIYQSQDKITAVKEYVSQLN